MAEASDINIKFTADDEQAMGVLERLIIAFADFDTTARTALLAYQAEVSTRHADWFCALPWWKRELMILAKGAYLW